MRHLALPLAMVAIEQAIGEGLAACDYVAQRIEEAAFIVACGIKLRSVGQPGGSNFKYLLRKVTHRAAARHRRFKRKPWNHVPECFALLDGPMFAQVPGG